jgi:argininosuccinate synthase
MTRIVLAYSGDLETSIAIPWLAERYQAEVVAVTLDLGQGGELTEVRERALAAGAVRAHVIDAREEFVRDYITPALQAGALDGDPLAIELGRALVAKRLVDVARMESAAAVAHACTGVAGTFPEKVAGTVSDAVVHSVSAILAEKPAFSDKGAGTFPGKVAGTFSGHGAATLPGAGADPPPEKVRSEPSPLDALIRALDPSLTVIALVQVWGRSRAEQLEYARRRNISVPAGDDRVSVASNLWGRSVQARSTDGLVGELPGTVFTLTRTPAECPDEPAYIEIAFDDGRPVRANGIEMPMLELIESLDIIGGAHGVGRIERNHDAAARSRVVHEAPAACLLHAAYRDLEALVLPDDFHRAKQPLSHVYTGLLRGGAWCSPTRDAIDAFMRSAQRRLTGTVRLKLYKGDLRTVGRQSPFGAQWHAPDGDARQDRAAVEGIVS